VPLLEKRRGVLFLLTDKGRAGVVAEKIKDL
jgi:hypothetical protein